MFGGDELNPGTHVLIEPFTITPLMKWTRDLIAGAVRQGART